MFHFQENIEPQLADEIFFEIVPFLNDHEQEVISNQLIINLKQIILQSKFLFNSLSCECNQTQMDIFTINSLRKKSI